MEVLKSIFCVILEMSIVSSIIGIVTLLLKNIFKTKISPKWLNIIWVVFLITLINPIRFQSSFSIYNLLSYENAMPKDKKEFIINKALDKHTKKESDVDRDSIEDKKGNNISNSNNNMQIFFDDNLAIIVDKILTAIVGIYIVVIFAKIITNVTVNIKIYNNSKRKFNNKRLNNILEKVKDQIEYKKDIELINQTLINSPAVYGTFKKRILLTEKILELSDKEIELIFLHELLHIKNKDMSFNKLVQFLKIAYWFNPIVKYLLNNVKKEIEIVNDENVVEKLKDEERNLYCKTLLKIALISNNKYCSTLSIINRTSELEERIKMIKEKNNFLKNKVLTISLIVIIVLGITVCFATNKIATKDIELNDTINSGDLYDENNSKNKSEPFDATETSIVKYTELMKPIEGEIKITAAYGKRVHPITGIEIVHSGIDIKAEKGDEVMSVANGVVEYADYDTNNGNSIEIKHVDEETDETYYSYYAHLSKIDVEVGMTVEAGEKIGEAGSTGKATGPHLHLEIRDSEKNTVNPMEILGLK